MQGGDVGRLLAELQAMTRGGAAAVAPADAR